MAGTQIAVPEHLKKFLANSQASTDADAMAASSISIPRISLRGRKFRVIEGGEEIKKPADELYVVILAVEPGAGLMAKTLYKKGYQSGDSSPPDCSSQNGITPDSWIQSPVSAQCRTCPMNAFGSATTNNGKKSKACKDSKRLWLALPEAIQGTVYNLGVPVTSLKALSEYGAMLKSNGVPPAAVITRLSMKDTEFPELIFEFVGVLEQEPMEQAMLRNEQKDWDNSSSGPLLEHQPSGQTMQAPGAQKLLESQAAKTDTTPTEKLSADAAASNW